MKKIVLTGTYFEQSHGDALLFDCVKYVFTNIAQQKNLDIEFEICDLFAKTSIPKASNHSLLKKSKSFFNIKGRIKRIIKTHTPSGLLYPLLKNNYNKKLFLTDYYFEKFKGSDMIVIAGGGLLKYNIRANFAPIFTSVIQTAQKLNIPVVINAIGIEGRHCKKDLDYLFMRDALNNPIVKMVTTRDRIDVLDSYFIKNKYKDYKKVCDTGVWASEAFSISKNSRSNAIGLNVITPSLFRDYKKNISKQELLVFWSRIIDILLEKNYDFKLFTHGLIDDYIFAQEIIQFCNLNEDRLVNNPKNQRDIIKNISNFKGIIANRLHATIVAYSLDIPAIGLAWNDKLLFWGNEINCPDRFFDYNNFNPEIIVDKLEDAIITGYDQKHKSNLKNNIYQSIESSFEILNHN
jgi:polysaccharide pyruvyl transferase WcaK-like protein